MEINFTECLSERMLGKVFFSAIALFYFCFLLRQDGSLRMLCRLRAEVKIVRNERAGTQRR